MKGISKEQAAEQAKKYSERVKEDDVNDILGKENKVKSIFEKVSVLQKYVKDVCDVFYLLKDRVTGKYMETPWSTITALTGALIYVISPVDLIPDLIPILGFLDDAAVFAFVIEFAQEDLTKYRKWRDERANIIDVD